MSPDWWRLFRSLQISYRSTYGELSEPGSSSYLGVIERKACWIESSGWLLIDPNLHSSLNPNPKPNLSPFSRFANENFRPTGPYNFLRSWYRYSTSNLGVFCCLFFWRSGQYYRAIVSRNGISERQVYNLYNNLLSQSFLERKLYIPFCDIWKSQTQHEFLLILRKLYHTQIGRSYRVFQQFQNALAFGT